MDHDELERFAEQVAKQYEQDSNRFEIEGYINSVVTNTASNIRAYMVVGATEVPEPTRTKLDTWSKQNRARISLQVGEVLRKILQKELLG